MISLRDTEDSINLTFEAIEMLMEDYEPDNAASVVIQKLYRALLWELNLDFEAADEVLAEAARELNRRKVQIGQELASNHWLQ